MKKQRSKLEAQLDLQIKAAGLSAPEKEYLFAADFGRRWRFDRAWPRIMVAVEVEGMVHRIKERFKGDAYKYLAAQALGWDVLRFTGEMIRKGEALKVLQDVLSNSEYRFDERGLVATLIELGILKKPKDWS